MRWPDPASIARVLLAALSLTACLPPAPPPDRPAPPMITAPSPPPPPPPMRLTLPKTGETITAPAGSRLEPGPIFGSDTVVLPSGASPVRVTLRRQHTYDLPLAPWLDRIKSDPVRRFVREVRRGGQGDDFVYVYALDQIGDGPGPRRRYAVRRMWPTRDMVLLCVADAPSAALAEQALGVCTSAAGLPPGSESARSE